MLIHSISTFITQGYAERATEMQILNNTPTYRISRHLA